MESFEFGQQVLFRVDICSMTSYFKVHCHSFGLEVTAGGIHVHDHQYSFSSLLMFLCSLYCKQYGPRSDCPQGEQSDQGSYIVCIHEKI